MSVQCKTIWQLGGTEEVRRFFFEPSEGFPSLCRAIVKHFPSLAGEDFAVFWEDEDSDFVLISSNEELAIALQNTCNIFRVYIKTAEKSKWSTALRSRFGVPTHRGVFHWLRMFKKHFLQKKQNQKLCAQRPSNSKVQSLSSSEEMNPFGALKAFLVSVLASLKAGDSGNNSSSTLQDANQEKTNAAPVLQASAPPQEPSLVSNDVRPHPPSQQAFNSDRPEFEHVRDTPSIHASPYLPNQSSIYPVLDTRILAAVEQMKQMGFTDEGGWLTQLVMTKNGDIEQVLEQLKPTKPVTYPF